MKPFSMFLFAGLIIVFSANADIPIDLDFETPTYSQIRITKMTGDQHYAIAQLGCEIVGYDEKGMELIVPRPQLTLIEETGVTFEIVHADLAEFYRSRYNARQTMGGFRTYDEIVLFIDSLYSTNTNIVAPKFSLATTLWGAKLWCLKISDNPTVDEDEPEVLYISLIHAREPAGGAAVLGFMKHLLDNYGTDPEITDLIDHRELYFIPVQNPDGYNWNLWIEPSGGGMWRKNLSENTDQSVGTDLNRNYGFKWGYDNIGSSAWPGSDTYRGTGPFSEPETAGVRDFVNSRNFTIIHNIHTYSNLYIWPWGYDRFYTDREEFYTLVGDSMSQYNNYAPGVSWRLYPTNGDADDWAWGDTISKPRIISVTSEIGSPSDGFWPDPSRIPTLVEENIYPNLFLAKIADNPYGIAPPQPPEWVGTTADSGVVSLLWEHRDTANELQSFQLVELADKETVIDSVEADNGYWEYERMYRSKLHSHSGEYSWGIIHEDRTHHWLVAATPSEVQPGDSLRCYLWYDLDNQKDFFYAQVSTDGGLTYTNLSGPLTTNTDWYGYNLGNGITGTSSGWVPAAFDLSPWAGEMVTIRLAYFTDSYGRGQGLFIDDIQNVDFYAVADTVSSGLVAGNYQTGQRANSDYWFRVNTLDTDNQRSRNSILTKVTVVDSYVFGDGNGDGEFNVSDLTFVIDLMFRGGPAPLNLAVLDMNCDSDTNVSDLTIIIDALFRGGELVPCRW